VSVVIPVLNDSENLRNCLRALAAQTLAPMEVIIVDNGSDDDSATVASTLEPSTLDSGAPKNSTLAARVLAEPVQGIARASATGYDAARGDVIARIDSDTLVGPGWVAAVAQLFQNEPVVAATGRGEPRGLTRFGGVLWRIGYMGAYEVSLWTLLSRPPLFGSAMAFRRDAWAEVSRRVHRGDPEIHDDIDLSLALDPARLVVRRPQLAVSVSGAPVQSLSGLVTRFRRAGRTLRLHGFRALPVVRWTRRLSAQRRRTLLR
jgi:cellulose synthase/poly-beta-1,6-N-acetylglucosamine synthase-like glycosyltransferase